MARFAAFVVFAVLASTAASAEVEIVRVPATCGPYPEIMEVLAARMPDPRAIAKGGDSRGEDVVLLIADANYWALVAKSAPGSVCVVASGFNWTAIDPKVVDAF